MIPKTDLVNKIINRLNDFGIDNIEEGSTTVFVSKPYYYDVEVANSDFNTFTKAHATMAQFFLEDGIISRRSIREWIESFDTELD